MFVNEISTELIAFCVLKPHAWSGCINLNLYLNFFSIEFFIPVNTRSLPPTATEIEEDWESENRKKVPMWYRLLWIANNMLGVKRRIWIAGLTPESALLFPLAELSLSGRPAIHFDTMRVGRVGAHGFLANHEQYQHFKRNSEWIWIAQHMWNISKMETNKALDHRNRTNTQFQNTWDDSFENNFKYNRCLWALLSMKIRTQWCLRWIPTTKSLTTKSHGKQLDVITGKMEWKLAYYIMFLLFQLIFVSYYLISSRER